MKTNVLALCGYFYSNINANTVCANNIIEELEKQGHHVFVLTYDEVERKVLDTEHCRSVELGPIRRCIELNRNRDGKVAKAKFILATNLRRLMIAPFFPKTPSFAFFRYYRAALRLIKEKNIDVVISFYKPYDTVNCALKIKNRLGQRISIVNYYLDLLTVPEDGDNFIGKYKKIRADKAFEKDLKVADLVVLPCSEEGKYAESKVRYVDFPLLLEKKLVDSGFIYDDSAINLCYIGTLDEINRNPAYLFDLVNKVNSSAHRKARLHIWGRIPKRFVDLCNENIVYHGFVDNECVHDLLSKSDFLVNVSNKITYKWIPSKIFQLFSVGKPIINVVKHANDVSLPYFARYKEVQNITEFDYDINRDAALLAEFITRNHEIVKNQDVLFEKSKPEYFVREISEVLNG